MLQTKLSLDEEAMQDIKNILDKGWDDFVRATIVNTTGQHFPLTDVVSIARVHTARKPDKASVQESLTRWKSGNQSLSLIDLQMNPDTKFILDNNSVSLKERIVESFRKINKGFGYEVFFASLWYTSLPCFDIENITSSKKGEKALLQKCSWKGLDIQCSSIFKTFPTDQGMCCVFNMPAANEIFVETEFTKIILKLQSTDQSGAFENTTVPDWFTRSSASEEGLQMGLSVMLDAHSNIHRISSYEADYVGFHVLVDSRENFPFVRRKGLKIKTGHLNLIALSATKIDADRSIYSVEPKKRKCLFGDERDHLIFHKNYSQANCQLEREIQFAQAKMQSLSNRSEPCTPWYLPIRPTLNILCDPWESELFERYMNEAKSKSSLDCQPDCQRVLYHPKLSSVPFSPCDERNVGISELCNLALDCDSETPNMFGQQVLDEYNRTLKDRPKYLKCLRTNIRVISDDLLFRGTFHSTTTTSYNAFEKDIAILQVFFDSATAVKFETLPRLNWVDFISNVGGLMGLCLGFNIFTIIEVACLFVDILKYLLRGQQEEI